MTYGVTTYVDIWVDFWHLAGFHHKVDLFTVWPHLAPEVHTCQTAQLNFWHNRVFGSFNMSTQKGFVAGIFEHLLWSSIRRADRSKSEPGIDRRT